LHCETFLSNSTHNVHIYQQVFLLFYKKWLLSLSLFLLTSSVPSLNPPFLSHLLVYIYIFYFYSMGYNPFLSWLPLMLKSSQIWNI
jgi:hypothetical protein